MNVRRTLLSVNTLLAVLAIFALFVCTGDLAKDVVDSYKGYLDYREMLVFLSTFLVVGLFVQDWHTQFWRLLTVRMPIRRYARNVFLWVWITTLCTAMLGQWLYIAYLRCKLPMLSEVVYSQPWQYDFLGEILLFDHPYGYLVAQTLCASLVCSSLAVLALLISVGIPDRLAAGFAPLMLYYLSAYGGSILRVPYYLSMDYQLVGHLIGVPRTDVLIMSMHVAIPLVCLPIFTHAVERRCENA